MQPMTRIISVNEKFQKSVNLRLDYNQQEKLDGYIPTRASVAVLGKLVEQFTNNKVDRSSILIGPYGKGKSHLLLVLLAMLVKENREKGKETEALQRLIAKVDKVDKSVAVFARSMVEQEKYYLPVIVNAGQSDLNRSLVLALREGLERAGLDDIAPDTYFEVARNTIENWEKNYSDTYQLFLKKIYEKNKKYDSKEKFIMALNGAESQEDALAVFKKIYPELTAGSIFEPMIQTDAVTLYKAINEALCKKMGYAGIVIVFDEFSKFVEGFPKDKFSGAMAVLQELCEAANASKEKGLHVILVAHKAMKEYQSILPKSVIDAYTGVEGRLHEVFFTSSLKNSYELIGNVIRKEQVSKVDELFARIDVKERTGLAYQLPYFSHLFEKDEFEDIVAKACYPLAPVTAYLLLKISEIAVQNERTVFTFLTNEELYSLPYFLKKASFGELLGAEQIYDYFSNVLKQEVANIAIHNEWLKADYALTVCKDKAEQCLIKTMALLNMVGKQDEMHANRDTILLGSGLEENVYDIAMQGLLHKQVVLYRTKTNTYAFKNNVGIDVGKEIQDLVERKFRGISITEEVTKLSELAFELPKRYNQKYAMTRYFAYKYMTIKQFMSLTETNYMFEEKDTTGNATGEKFSDGKMIALLKTEEDIESVDEICKKVMELADDRILVLVPEEAFVHKSTLQKILAIGALRSNEKFVKENKASIQELDLYEEDLRFELNVYLEQQFYPFYNQCSVIYGGKIFDKKEFGEKKYSAKFNQFLSDIAEDYYENTPKINNELINKRKLSSPIKKARLKIIENILENQEYNIYREGTSPEATIFRAVLVNTGVIPFEGMGKENIDPKVTQVLKKIDEFLFKARKKKEFIEKTDKKSKGKKFSELYKGLKGKGFGLRDGVLPLYLAYRIQEQSDCAVIYLNNKEIALTAETIENINERPNEYSIFIDSDAASKKDCIQRLAKMFAVQTKKKDANLLLDIYDGMYEWYCSLPQVSRVYSVKDCDKNVQNGIKTFRKQMLLHDRNAHELIIEILPHKFGLEDYNVLPDVLLKMKTEMEQYAADLKSRVVAFTRKELEFSESDDLLASLKEWAADASLHVQMKVLSAQTTRLLREIDKLENHREQDIVNALSRCLLEQFIEDWKEDSFDQYKEALYKVITELEHSAMKESVREGKRLIFTNQDGVEIKKILTDTELDSSCEFLENEIEEALEDFGSVLETEQKVVVMLKMIEKLLQG